MMSIKERYLSDSVFHNLVELMIAQIETGNFTPTELREASLLAGIICVEKSLAMRGIIEITLEINEALEKLSSEASK